MVTNTKVGEVKKHRPSGEAELKNLIQELQTNHKQVRINSVLTTSANIILDEGQTALDIFRAGSSCTHRHEIHGQVLGPYLVYHKEAHHHFVVAAYLVVGLIQPGFLIDAATAIERRMGWHETETEPHRTEGL